MSPRVRGIPLAQEPVPHLLVGQSLPGFAEGSLGPVGPCLFQTVETTEREGVVPRQMSRDTVLAERLTGDHRVLAHTEGLLQLLGEAGVLLRATLEYRDRGLGGIPQSLDLLRGFVERKLALVGVSPCLDVAPQPADALGLPRQQPRKERPGGVVRLGAQR